AQPLEPGLLDELAGEGARRVLEDRAGIGVAERLSLRALLLRRADLLADLRLVAGMQPEAHVGDDEARRQIEEAIAELQVLAGNHLHLAVAIDALDGGDHRGDLAAESAGVHQQAAADGAGDAFAELESGELSLH